MKITKRRKIIWSLMAIFFLATILSKDITKTIFQISSPNKLLTARITESAGWGSFFYGSQYRIELISKRTNERVNVMDHSQFKGWHSYSPTEIKWKSNSRRFRCGWWIHEDREKIEYRFNVKQNPLAVTKIDSKGHTY